MTCSVLPDSALVRSGDPSVAAEAWAVVGEMYRAYLAGERAAIDACLEPDATVWDSVAGPLLAGRADLDRLREQRPPAGTGPVETALTAYDPVVDLFGGHALLRYWLAVDFAPGADGVALTPELSRNTALLRRAGDGRWRIVHLHEDVRDAGGTRVDTGV
ncbi:YybH family protein [Kitasatospora phosalacinea]|uniref:YybH family protein n=1 Tax=Kitasatospora phosalacinea TaxID=2065 RepID=UPI003654BB10